MNGTTFASHYENERAIGANPNFVQIAKLGAKPERDMATTQSQPPGSIDGRPASNFSGNQKTNTTMLSRLNPR